jgi:hypothetical protein
MAVTGPAKLRISIGSQRRPNIRFVMAQIRTLRDAEIVSHIRNPRRIGRSSMAGQAVKPSAMVPPTTAPTNMVGSQ